MEEASERSLLGDLKKMLEDQSFSDMVFLCGDPPEGLPASRMLVAARSPVLEAMLLKAGMRESTQTRIALPEIDADTMRICLAFFYTDTVKQSSPSLQHETFVKVIAAARFLLIPKLEQMALSCLRLHIERCGFFHATPHLLLDAAKAYTRGVDILRAQSDDIHLHKMLCDIAFQVELFEGGWPWECQKYLSRQALAHMVQNLGINPVEQSTLWEYFLFVRVVTWCAAQLVLHADDPAAEKKCFQHAIDEFLPGFCNVSLGELSLTAHKPLDVESLRVFTLLKERLAECLEHVPIKLYKIPPLILSMNIEPLGILSRSAFLSAYRVQALSRPHMRWDDLWHHKHYHIMSDGTVTYCTSNVFTGFVKGNTGIQRDNIVNFEWEVVIMEACEQIRVGFCFSSYFDIRVMRSVVEGDAGLVIGDEYGSWALSTDGHLYHDCRKEEEVYCDAFAVDIGLRIGVHLTSRTFAFSVNGSKGIEMRLPWFVSDELQAPIYPAISMVSPGRARIQMVVQDWMEHPPHKELLDPNQVKAHR